MEYKIVRDKYLSFLSKSVNEYLKKGWKAQGGIFYDPRNDEYLQAMVRSNLFIDEPTDFGQGGSNSTSKNNF